MTSIHSLIARCKVIFQIPLEAELSLNFTVRYWVLLASCTTHTGLKTARCPGMSNRSPEFNIAAEIGAKIEIWNQTEGLSGGIRVFNRRGSHWCMLWLSALHVRSISTRYCQQVAYGGVGKRGEIIVRYLTEQRKLHF